jgi:hypothetical protein
MPPRRHNQGGTTGTDASRPWVGTGAFYLTGSSVSGPERVERREGKAASMDAHLNHARMALRSGDITGARASLSQALERNPRDAVAWRLLAETVDDPQQRAECLAQAQALEAGRPAPPASLRPVAAAVVFLGGPPGGRGGGGGWRCCRPARSRPRGKGRLKRVRPSHSGRPASEDPGCPLGAGRPGQSRRH